MSNNIFHTEGKTIDLEKAVKAEYQATNLIVPIGLVAWGVPIWLFFKGLEFGAAFLLALIFSMIGEIVHRLREKVVVIYNDNSKVVIRKPFGAQKLTDEINNLISRRSPNTNDL